MKVKILVLAFIFFGISLFFSMLGIGGGMFYMPVLIFSKFSVHKAAPLSLILIFATSISALFVFLKNKMVDWKLAMVIDPPTDVMAFAGGYFSSFVPSGILKMMLAFVLIIAGFLMMFNINYSKKLNVKKFYVWKRVFNGREYYVNLLAVLPITAGIGLLSGMLGITGGVIKLPLMVIFCGVPMDVAIATSTVMVALTALFGLSGHIVSGNVNFYFLVPFLIAAFLGGQIGSRISINADKKLLKKLFGFVLLLIAIKLVIYD